MGGAGAQPEHAPFRLQLIALLLCLRHHLEAEAHERRIPLQRLDATFSAAVSSAWDLQELSASFTLWLDPEASAEARARADAAAFAAMQERMRLSPVPRNRPAGTPLQLALRLADRPDQQHRPGRQRQPPTPCPAGAPGHQTPGTERLP